MAEQAVMEQQDTPAPEVVADAVTEETSAKPKQESRKFDEDYYKKALDGQQKRLDELTWRLRENERRAQVETPPPPEPVATKVPTLEAFGFDEAKFQTAQTEYLRTEAERIVNERLAQADQARAFEQRTATFREREKAFAAKTADYAEKVYNGDTLPISDVMAEEITSSELGAEIAYYLANHREVARQLYALPPREVAREIGKIEAKLSATPVVPLVPKVSQAPPPPAKIEADEPEVEKDPANMTDAQFNKWRRRQIAQRK